MSEIIDKLTEQIKNINFSDFSNINDILKDFSVETLADKDKKDLIDYSNTLSDEIYNLLNILNNNDIKLSKKEKIDENVKTSDTSNEKDNKVDVKITKLTPIKISNGVKEIDLSKSNNKDIIVDNKSENTEKEDDENINDLLLKEYNNKYSIEIQEKNINNIIDDVINKLKNTKEYKFIKADNNIPPAVIVECKDIYNYKNNINILNEIANKITAKGKFAFTTITSIKDNILFTIVLK